MKRSIIYSMLISLLLLMSACTPFVSHKEEKMETMAIKLDKLTKMVESAVRYDGLTLERGERPLLICATAEDENLFHWFDEKYVMRVDIKTGHAVVLICTKDKKGLYEDTNCVEGPDVDLRQYNNQCDFTLTDSDVRKACE